MELAAALLRAEQPFCSVDELKAFSQECGFSLPESYAYLAAAAAGLDQENDPDQREFFEYWVKPSFRLSDVKRYEEDPYYKAVPFQGETRGRWCYARETILPGELFVEGDMLLTNAGRVLPQLAFFTEKYTFPAVFENGRDWMSLAPNETVTLQKPIAEAYGRVLTYGLGLGYYAFMTARKKEVSSVTVVEREQKAIDLFNEYLLPYFTNPEKIVVIREDALQYAERLKKNEYDCVFADIWRDAGDGMELYQTLKKKEKNAPGTHFSYWIEKSMDLYLDATLWPQ